MDGPPAVPSSMVASGQRGQGDAADVHAPFTTAERMEQLNEIDIDIISLLDHTGAAMRCIAQTPAELDATAAPAFDPAAPTSPAAQQFAAIQQAFLATLDRVDKRLKRQIWALEEAGIVTLGKSSSTAPAALGNAAEPPSQQGTASLSSQRGAHGGGAAGTQGAGGHVPPAIPPPIEPDGTGRYGSLDVGRLNAAGGDVVSRDMERELWKRARTHIAALAGDAMQE